MIEARLSRGVYTHVTGSFSEGDLFGRKDKATLSRASLLCPSGEILTVWKTPRGEVIPSNEYLEHRRKRSGFPANINLFEPSEKPPRGFKLPNEFQRSNPSAKPEEIRFLDGQYCVGAIPGEMFQSALDVARKDTEEIDESRLREVLVNRLQESAENGQKVTRNGITVQELSTMLAQLSIENSLALASWSSVDPLNDLRKVKPSSNYLKRYKRHLLAMFSY